MKTINQLLEVMTATAASHEDIKDVHTGNVSDMSKSKGDVYPCVWFELPLEGNYISRTEKEITMAMTVLMIPEMDNLVDEIEKQSLCEIIGDEIFLQIQDIVKTYAALSNISFLCVKNYNNDRATGARFDFTITATRSCRDYKDKFK
jgi:hypothetical protein